MMLLLCFVTQSEADLNISDLQLRSRVETFTRFTRLGFSSRAGGHPKLGKNIHSTCTAVVRIWGH